MLNKKKYSKHCSPGYQDLPLSVCLCTRIVIVYSYIHQKEVGEHPSHPEGMQICMMLADKLFYLGIQQRNAFVTLLYNCVSNNIVASQFVSPMQGILDLNDVWCQDISIKQLFTPYIDSQIYKSYFTVLFLCIEQQIILLDLHFILLIFAE